MNFKKEDYIKAIYELGGHEKTVTNKELVERLNISAPSVSEMMRKLVVDEYVVYREYIGVMLTEKGIQKGWSMRKKHLLWEVFLVEKLGYSWEEVDQEAEDLEHATSDKLEEKLDVFLNHPKFCPHGSPITLDRGYEFENLMDYDQKIGKIIRIKDQRDLILFCNENNLKIDDYIKIIRKDSKGVKIISNELEGFILIPKEYAREIFIKEAGE